ncbi:MAG: DNA repair protein RecN [Burkholderiaceae bacterium]
MLHTLSIRDFVIVDTLELEFEAGFTVFSGETGAGKSILIDALALVLGERGDAGMVREGRPRADLSAAFTTDAAAEAWLVRNEMSDAVDGAAEQPDRGQVLLRRTIDANGRSKAWINGASATLAQSRALGDHLVDIHGQHAHQLLLRAGAQREMLDAQGGLTGCAAEVAEAWHAWRAVTTQLARLETDARAVAAEREQLGWQIEELEALALQPGEWDALGDEHRRLAHAASLIEGTQASIEALSEGDDAIASRLSTIVHRLQQLAAVDPLLDDVLASLEPAAIEIAEAGRTLNDYLSRLDLDPTRLKDLEARMEALFAAGRKLRIAPEHLLGELDDRRARLAELEAGSDINALRAQEAAEAERYRVAATTLSARRAVAGRQLSAAVTDAMQTLNMTGGRFDIALIAGPPSAHGIEDIEFRVAAHPGATPRAIAKVASGGELARISLAISVIASVATTVPTLIFDEVDSGIGGAVAEVVGRLLRRLGETRQVLCVTHLPQVAALGNEHFAVRKETDDALALTRIDKLDAARRVDEVARMLGGIEITTTTRKHARELLAAA